jgi:hypothetical protein
VEADEAGGAGYEEAHQSFTSVCFWSNIAILVCSSFIYSSRMSSVDSPSSPFSAKTWIAAVLRGEPPLVGNLSDTQCKEIGETAIQHGVATLLHHVLSQSSDWTDLPDPLREAILAPTRQTVARDLLRERDLGQLLEKISTSGIPFLLIKGAGLAYTHYPQAFLRDRCDTDILFPDQAAFEQAWELLENLGYSRRNTLSGDYVGYQYCCWKPLALQVQQVLDCHTRINDYLFFADAFSFQELMDGSVAVPPLGESARTLGPVHALLLACMHLVATTPLGNADRLIWLYDMQVLGQSFSDDDWREFLDLATQRHLCGSCLYSLTAAGEYFSHDAPEDILEGLARSASSETFKPGVEMKRWQYYYHVFKSVPGLRKKARLLKEHFIPSADYLMEKYQTRNRLILPYLYVHRVFTGLKRYF